jgi:cell division protease FtsH
VVDEEVSRLLRQAEGRAVALLRDHQDALEWLAARLVEKETVDGSVVLDVLREKKTQLVPRAGRTRPPGASGPA